jgi:ParB-like chromosome segregation protein Spo0J
MALKDLGTRASETLRIDLQNVSVEPKFNIRTDYGDIDELARQIAENGQRVPGKVRLSDDGKSAVLVDGHRRYKAIAIANEKHGAKIDSFLCIPEEKGANEESRVVDMFMYGTGKPLTLLEQAEAVTRLQKYGWAIAKISKTIGKSAAYVNQLLTLNGSTHSLREAVKKNTISPTAALKLATATPAKQESVLEKVQDTLSSATAPKGTTPKKKQVLKVKDVEKAMTGTPMNISAKSIKDLISKVESKSEENATWKAVKYGLELALGIEVLDYSKFDS